MNKTTDRIKRRWDNYRARVAELEAENAKLRKRVEQLAELVMMSHLRTRPDIPKRLAAIMEATDGE